MEKQDCVSKAEFDKLEKKVVKVEETVDETVNLLNAIDKKVDGILIKIEDSNKINDLTLQPIYERLSKLEDTQKWTWRTIAAAIITLAIKILFDVSHLIKG